MRRLVPTLALLLAATACGHKATEADCRLIVDRSIEVQLDVQGITDPAARAKEKETLEKKAGDVDIKGCLGRRVTEGMLLCVKSAKTPDQVTACLQ
jgi:F420-dependent methylenetetrahydromethanopterin dehydrogenase